MAKNLANEALVKKALNIDSFRNLSKEKIIEFVSLIPNMDKDVAMSIINQFPAFADNAKTMVECLKSTCETVISANGDSQKEAVAAYKLLLDNLSTVLLRDNLSSEEREYVTAQMISVADKIAAKDSENKQFLSGIVKCVSYVALGALAICATVLGVNAKGSKIPQLS